MIKNVVLFVLCLTIGASAPACPPGYSEPVPQVPINGPSPNDLGDNDCYALYIDKVDGLYQDYLDNLNRVCEHNGSCYKEPCVGVWTTLYEIDVKQAWQDYLDCVANLPSGAMAVEPCPHGFIAMEPEPGYPAPDFMDPGSKDGGYSQCYLDYIAKRQAAYESYHRRMRACLRFPGMPQCYNEACALLEWTYYLFAIDDARTEYEWCILTLDR